MSMQLSHSEEGGSWLCGGWDDLMGFFLLFVNPKSLR